MIPDEAVEVVGKSFGTAKRYRGVSADVDVPIARTGKPVITVIEKMEAERK